MIFLPIAIAFGFVGEQLVAILIMLGSATTVTCFVMAKNMGRSSPVSAALLPSQGCQPEAGGSGTPSY